MCYFNFNNTLGRRGTSECGFSEFDRLKDKNDQNTRCDSRCPETVILVRLDLRFIETATSKRCSATEMFRTRASDDRDVKVKCSGAYR